METTAASTAKEAETALLSLSYYEDGSSELVRTAGRVMLAAEDNKHFVVLYWGHGPSARLPF